MNLRVVGEPHPAGPIHVRVVDLDNPGDLTSDDDRVLGPDGNPLDWSDGLPTGGPTSASAVTQDYIRAAMTLPYEPGYDDEVNP